jgi:hypothetical protein
MVCIVLGVAIKSLCDLPTFHAYCTETAANGPQLHCNFMRSCWLGCTVSMEGVPPKFLIITMAFSNFS